MHLLRPVLLACALGVSVQASAQQLSGTAAELARQVQAMQQTLAAVDARLAQIEGIAQQNQQLLGLLKEVETLKAELSRLRGQAEMQTHQMESLGKRQNDLYVDLDQRVSELARSGKPVFAAAPSAPSAPAQPPAAAPPAEAPVAGEKPAVAPAAMPPAVAAPQLDPLVESRTYETALNHFREANYAAAIAGFKGFLKAYPDSALAPNAQYWVGYSHYALKDYKTALAHQQKLLIAYPGNAKVPDAMLNIATNQIALDNLDEAKKTLEELVAKHPGTNAATLASRRLAALK
ncbi:MAG: tol-pal system protein YbgF [Hydrogenophilales bacterium 16-64-46]|nr:MAG: tol-pal system protein YbgF [Hydrogenophilales bacterium 12-64-13]OYZ04415.1 MAG: tol-pal system protein YbgF [Hydrogenophilales bacterium 16-64-46]OZA38221.1 MAG: tol-pal system protein YbgF [Hydrogenophilales bacterium 17-64-34]HQS99124.1 tol-pal system protein YbgF [Thiobacillus sp.]